MKASEIIKDLQEKIQRTGDLDVYVCDEMEEESESSGIRIYPETRIGDGLPYLPNRFFIKS
jgi:hypothetical protein